MSLVGFQARNHEQQVRKRGVLSVVDCRATDPEWFARLHARFRFTLDAAALPTNAKLARYFSPEDDGLSKPWAGERIWCNPPFSQLEAWVKKGHESTDAALIVMLIPANRTEQPFWHRYVEPYRDMGGRLKTEFVRGRQRFIHPESERVGMNERPPFGVLLLVWGR
jgi:phage N-6-adenine-methyltransferase